MRSVIIHDDNFVMQVHPVMELLEKGFDVFFVCCVDQLEKHLLHLQTDSSDDCHVRTHISGFLNHHWQRLVFRLPKFRSLFPQVRRGFVDVDDVLIAQNEILELANVINQLLDVLFYSPVAEETLLGARVNDVLLVIDVCQSVSCQLNAELLFDHCAPVIQRQMHPFSQKTFIL